jgi:FdhD protein
VNSLEIAKITVTKVKVKPNYLVSNVEDEVAVEAPLCIFINEDYYATLLATPTMKKELAVGFLFSENIIHSIDDVQLIDSRENDIKVQLKTNINLRNATMDTMNLIMTACSSSSRTRTRKSFSLQKIESNITVGAEQILSMFIELNKRSNIHHRTRGTHSAMICSSNGDVLAFAEDVGRHNAIDKVIGSILIEKTNLTNCVLISSGRQSVEMVQKAVRGGIPVVASITAPLTTGIQFAEVAGITLLCFAQGNSMKIYTNPQRIIINQANL